MEVLDGNPFEVIWEKKGDIGDVMLKTGQMIKLEKRGAISNYPYYVCICVFINRTQTETDRERVSEKGSVLSFGF